MKIITGLFIIMLSLNVGCESPQRLVLEKFIDKSPQELFEVYHTVFNKEYDLKSEIGLKRFKIFEENLMQIKETNSKNLSHKAGINQFTDLTKEEFIQKFLTNSEIMNKHIKSSSNIKNLYKFSGTIEARTKIDHSGLFNPARDQGNCGSCWAFTTAGVSEANWWAANQSSPKISLAPQNLIDCDTGNNGCNGGWYNSALEYVRDKGLVQDKDYPYIYNQGACNIPTGASTFKILDYTYCDDCQMDQWYSLLQQGPLAIAVDASQFSSYTSGIYDLLPCGQVNHAIIAVGWDIDSIGEILTIRNSWGTNWGENGYMRIRVNPTGNTCSATNYGYLAQMTPPPTPTACFNLNSSWITRNTWMFNTTFTGSVTFKATGTDFTFGSFYDSGLSYNGYLVDIKSNLVSISSANNQIQLCSFQTNISSTSENSYIIKFDPTSGKESMSVIINGNTLYCNQENIYVYKLFSNYYGFTGVNTTQICDVTISNN